MVRKPTDEEWATSFRPNDAEALVRLTGSYIVAHSFLEVRLRLLARELSRATGNPLPGPSDEDLKRYLDHGIATITALADHAAVIRSAISLWTGCAHTRHTLAHRIPVTMRQGKKSSRLLTWGFDQYGEEEYIEVVASAACAEIPRMSKATDGLQAAILAVVETER